jgi:hypothetical protein
MNMRLFLPALITVFSCAFVAQALPETNSISQVSLTFNKDVAPILFRHCAGCHRPGQAAPFSLLGYSDAKKRSKQIVEVVEKRYMPPWLPEPGHGEFQGDLSLKPHQIETIRRWVVAGAVEGAPGDLPALPKWSEDWLGGKPDLIVQMSQAYSVPAEGKDIYRNFVFPIPLAGPKFVRGVELIPGNWKVVHHAFINVDPTPFSRRLAKDNPPGFDGMMLPETARMPGGQFMGWQPGKLPSFTPEGLAWLLEKNTDLVLQLHLHPTGKPESVRPSVGFYFTDRAPTNAAFRINLNPLIIDIPAGAKDYSIQDSYTLPVDVELIGVKPHAHYLAKRMEGTALLPDGTKKDLILIKEWNFNWQADYLYTQPILLPKGTALKMRFTYDNSDDNVRNPNHPPKRVKYGLETTDEMGELWFQVLARSAADRAALGQDFYKYLAQRTIDYNEHVLKENPDDAEAHTRAGRARLFFGQAREAFDHYQAAVRADPKHDRAWYELGFIYLRLNRMPEAQDAFEKVIQLNPDDYEALGSLAVIYMQKGDFERAEARLRAALQINPADEVARGNLEEVLKARAATKSQRK